MYLVRFTKQAAKDAKKLRSAGLENKAKQLIDTVREDPFAKPPAYEALVGNLSGLYSRRISLQHRLVYQVLNEPIAQDGITYDGVVKIIRMWTHYEDIR